MDRQKFCSYWYIYKMDNFMTKLKSRQSRLAALCELNANVELMLSRYNVQHLSLVH